MHGLWHVQNACLQEQVHSLFEEVTSANEMKLQLVEQLARTNRTLEASKEEEQLLKLTIAEKSSQLLHAEDQLL